MDRVLPRCQNLTGVTFEFHESYYPQLGDEGILAELERARYAINEKRRKELCL